MRASMQVTTASLRRGSAAAWLPPRCTWRELPRTRSIAFTESCGRSVVVVRLVQLAPGDRLDRDPDPDRVRAGRPRLQRPAGQSLDLGRIGHPVRAAGDQPAP